LVLGGHGYFCDPILLHRCDGRLPRMKEERRVDEFFYPPSVSRPMATFLLFLCIQNKMRVYFEGDYNDGFFLEIKWSN